MDIILAKSNSPLPGNWYYIKRTALNNPEIFCWLLFDLVARFIIAIKESQSDLQPMNFFSYGSLMFNQIWNQVVQGNYRCCCGSLSGYDRRTVKDEIYPCLIKGSSDSRIEGVVYFDVSNTDMQQLDRFEGSEYMRVRESCTLQNGKEVEVETYIWNGSLEWVSPASWDVEWFKKEGIQLFLRDYKGFTD